MATVVAVRTAWIEGGPAPYREALATRLVERGWVVTSDSPRTVSSAADESSRTATGAMVVVHYCDSEAAWERVATSIGADALGVVAVILTLDPELYRRAIALGAGAVHHDTSTEIMAHVIESAGHGEALLPMHVARQLVRTGTGSATSEADVLNELEIGLLRGIVEGETIAALADGFHFSERTVRRRLQSAYLKLGVDDRTGAIRAIERDRLLD
jgi:DNA-binding NarL/FixJ family response regulator